MHGPRPGARTGKQVLISNSLMPAFKNATKKLKVKTTRECEKRKYSKFALFLALSFFKDNCLRRHQRVCNQHKILRYFCSVLIALSDNFNCKCEKTVLFQTLSKI